jgi:Sigma-70 region 2
MGPPQLEARVSKDADTSFEEFVHGRSAHLFKLALLLTGQNRAAAEDLLQIALERAYRRWASLSRGRSPEPYVRRVLVNASIDRWRTLGRRAERPLDAIEAGPAVADRTGEVADRDLLVRSLAMLPPSRRCTRRYMSAMTDIEWQLREAMRAAVADAQPPGAVMELVLRRHRRRNARLAAAIAIALAVVVAAVPVASALRGSAGQPANVPASAAPLFPGGGRLLFADGAGLEWLYPDGRTVEFAPGFTGATLEGTGLLAWKQTKYGFSYYTMNLDGSAPRLVLPAGHSKQFAAVEAHLSPDGTRLAYEVQDIHPGGQVTDEIWSADLETGQKSDLGPGSGIAWKDNTTILADSAGQRSLLLVNVSDRSRATYLTADDPSLVRAYERARPGARPPAFISSDGWSTGGGTSALAVSLAARSSRGFFSKPAEVLVGKNRVLAFAPNDRQQLALTWGPRGIFLLQSGAGDNPPSWANGTYAGTDRGTQLARVQVLGDPGWDAGAFSPAGDVIALSPSDDSDTVTFAAVPSPACELAGTCLHFPPKPLFGRGTLLAWAP